MIEVVKIVRKTRKGKRIQSWHLDFYYFPHYRQTRIDPYQFKPAENLLSTKKQSPGLICVSWNEFQWAQCIEVSLSFLFPLSFCVVEFSYPSLCDMENNDKRYRGEKCEWTHSMSGGKSLTNHALIFLLTIDTQIHPGPHERIAFRRGYFSCSCMARV